MRQTETITGAAGGQAAQAPILALHGVAKSFSATPAVLPTDLAVRRGEFFALLGPSGCGKSTLLRLIAGLETPDAGIVSLDGRDITALPAYRRPLNLVFQSYALFPHMDVAENIAFGLRQEGVARREREARVGEALDLVRMSEFSSRRPETLSGGQQQRVALARALVKRPSVLLLDEPMAALDRRLREDMQEELRRIQRHLGTSFVMVTHDQDEAMRLADRIAVMKDGRILQCAAPDELYRAPADAFVARFFGEANLMPARLIAVDEGRARLAFEDGSVLAVPAPATLTHGKAVLAVIRPEYISPVAPAMPQDERLAKRAIVTQARFLGDVSQLKIAVEGLGTLRMTIANHAVSPMPRAGDSLTVTIDGAHATLVPAEGGA